MLWIFVELLALNVLDHEIFEWIKCFYVILIYIYIHWDHHLPTPPRNYAVAFTVVASVAFTVVAHVAYTVAPVALHRHNYIKIKKNICINRYIYIIYYIFYFYLIDSMNI